MKSASEITSFRGRRSPSGGGTAGEAGLQPVFFTAEGEVFSPCATASQKQCEAAPVDLALLVPSSGTLGREARSSQAGLRVQILEESY